MAKKYTKEFLISELQRFYKEHSVIPTNSTIQKYKPLNAKTFRDYFGSWNTALKEAGFETKKERDSKLPKNTKKINICPSCQKEIITDEYYNQQFCNSSCAANHNNSIRTIESRQKQRISILSNYGRTDEDTDPFWNYRVACKFKIPKNLTKFILGNDKQFKDEKNSKHTKTMDHRYSVAEGFKNKIDPSILSHPANCNYMTRGENAKKLDKCDITLEQLLTEIKLWDEKIKQFGFNYEHKILNRAWAFDKHTRDCCPFCGHHVDNCICNIKYTTKILPSLQKYFNLNVSNLGTPKFLDDWNNCKKYINQLLDQHSLFEITEIIKFDNTRSIIKFIRHLGIQRRIFKTKNTK